MKSKLDNNLYVRINPKLKFMLDELSTEEQRDKSKIVREAIETYADTKGRFEKGWIRFRISKLDLEFLKMLLKRGFVNSEDSAFEQAVKNYLEWCHTELEKREKTAIKLLKSDIEDRSIEYDS